MTLEDIADLIRANSANPRRMEELHTQADGQLLNLQNDVTDLRGDVRPMWSDVAAVRASLDLAETVAAMRKQSARLEPEVEGLKRRPRGGGSGGPGDAGLSRQSGARALGRLKRPMPSRKLGGFLDQ